MGIDIAELNAFPTYYWGVCPYGDKEEVKYHSGHEVVPYVHHNDIIVVNTHCGAQMFIEGEGERPPAFATKELCKNCHRSYAWETMIDHLKELERLAARMERLIDKIETDNLTPTQISMRLKRIVSDIRRSSSGDLKVPELRLVASEAAGA